MKGACISVWSASRSYRLGVHASDVRAALRRAILRQDGGGDDGCAAASLSAVRRAGLGEFCYKAFTIGCACATADVNLTSREARVDLPHPERHRFLLQHDHTRADDQHRTPG